MTAFIMSGQNFTSRNLSFESWNMPSGILIYWVTTNVWSIGQQYIVNKLVKKEFKKTEEKQKLADQQRKIEISATISADDSNKKKKRNKKK
jgi:YidC/Oxa1 family membrane protein insertase